ncbi:hypothetical protein RLOatenuis_7660 [Rickettsiales bacterium]|nr:hypothetical protein RLOatenuis_7660 [Rickettsiales bacterium]
MELDKANLAWLVSIMLTVALLMGLLAWRSTLRNQTSLQLGTEFYLVAMQGYQTAELEKIASSGKSQYPFLAKLKLAELAFQQNNKEKAISIYQEIVSDKRAQRFIRDTAAYLSTLTSFSVERDIGHMLKIITKDDFIYRDSGKFLEALFLAKQKNFPEATAIFEEISDRQAAPYHLRVQAQELGSLYK